MRGPRLAGGLLAGLLLGSAVAVAHPLAPVLLELVERPSGEVLVRFKQPLDVPPWVRLEPQLPDRCRALAEGDATGNDREEVSLTRSWRIDCAPEGLAGSTVGVDGLAAERMQALVRVELADGRTFAAVLDPGRADFTVPAAQGAIGVARQYGGLGFDHILGGLDHLLFVLGLLFLVQGARRLVATITAFTVGHSITLSLAALGLVPLSPGPAEVAIAATLVLLAVELTREDETAWHRRPWLMAGLFGLLHGLGFAGALAETGLPAREIPLALASFNVGIELGQLLFVLAFVALASAGRLIEPGRAAIRARLSLAVAYAVGTLGVYWCCVRLWSL